MRDKDLKILNDTKNIKQILVKELIQTERINVLISDKHFNADKYFNVFTENHNLITATLIYC